MNLRNQSVIEQDSLRDEIQTGVDVVLSIVIAVGKVAPIPFLSIAAETVQKIVDTVHAVNENKEALEDLANEAKGIIVVLWGAYQQSHDKKIWPAEGLRDVLEGLVSILQDICRFVNDNLSRGVISRIWYSKRDPSKLKKYKKALDASLERFKLCSHMTLNGVMMQIKDTQNDTKSEAKTRREDEAINKLQAKVAPGASYDSDARSAVPTCYPGTREAIMECFKDWVKNSEDHPFLWMYGPAGCGKTTIMGTIAKECDDEETLAASFFFSRSANDRPSENTRLITTLAYQLCLSITEIRPHIANAITHDPNVFAKSLSGQMTELLIKPLNIITAQKNWKKATDQRRKLVVIDGLDECDGPGKRAQIEILDLLLLASTQLSSRLLFLIASRPEHIIRTYFSTREMNSLTKGLPLGNDYRVENDIKTYLEARFTKIKEIHPARDNIPIDWPARDDYAYLIRKASGQFIYVSVVMDFVESTDSLPTVQLRTVRNELPQPENGKNETPFAPLDTLYCHILSLISRSHLQKAMEIVRAMIFGGDSHNHQISFILTLNLADSLFAQEPGESRLVLSGLRALIRLPDDRPRSNFDSRLRFFHASFVDFLLDRSRSGELFIEAQEAHANLARHWIRYYNKHSLRSEEFQDQNPDIPSLGFEMILEHCQKALLTPELQHDLRTLHLLLPVPSKLRVTGDCWDDSRQFWAFIYLILRFLCWLKGQNPDTLKDLYDQLLHRFKVSLQNEWSKYSSDVQKFLPLALTFRKATFGLGSNNVVSSPLIRVAMNIIDTKVGYSDSDPLFLRYFNCKHQSEQCFDPATKLLCQILTDFKASITERDFDDQMQYAEFALMVAESILPPDAVSYKELETCHSSLQQAATLLDMILNKAAPHTKLAHLLRRKSVEFDLQLLPVTQQYRDMSFRENCYYSGRNRAEKDRVQLVECLKEVSVNNLLYIKRSGIRIGGHTHLPKFDPAHWCCAICTAEEQGIEIPPDLPAYPLQLAVPDSRFIFIQDVLRTRIMIVPVIFFAGGIWFGLKRFFLVR